MAPLSIDLHAFNSVAGGGRRFGVRPVGCQASSGRSGSTIGLRHMLGLAWAGAGHSADPC
eukprot:scaffold671235_cov67-Prasinocladus_malaysianus.AAC.1